VSRRVAVLLVLVGCGVLLATAPAMAQNGEGWAGETTDRIVTFFSLGVLCFFPLVALVFTLVEHRFERRRERRESARMRQRTGW
jgi:hypothetical protein